MGDPMEYMPPPPGGNQNAGPALLVVTWLCTAICTVVVSLKLWTRFKIIGQTGWDDALTVLALVCNTVYVILCTQS